MKKKIKKIKKELKIEEEIEYLKAIIAEKVKTVYELKPKGKYIFVFNYPMDRMDIERVKPWFKKLFPKMQIICASGVTQILEVDAETKVGYFDGRGQ